jgi:hypothetical protein
MKIADLKRLPAGTKLRLVHCLRGPVSKLRIVVSANSYRVLFTGDGIAEGNTSYLLIPKASEFRSDPNGFSVLESDGQEVGARYEFVSDDSGVPNV